MKSHFVEKKFSYDGTQLRSLFGYLDHGIQGDSVISWIGPCAVSFAEMVDGEDLLAGATIAGDEMLHFVIEKFHTNLFAAVTLQRLFASICLDILREKVVQSQMNVSLRRSGDDIYLSGSPGHPRDERQDQNPGESADDCKMSISIATLSPVSALIHFAINCANGGTPVKTAALSDLGIDARDFAKAAMSRLTEEVGAIEVATVKVRWVK